MSAKPETSPPFLGTVYFTSESMPTYGWSNSFFMKATTTTAALTALESIKDSILACQTFKVHAIASEISAFGLRGDSYVRTYAFVSLGEGEWGAGNGGGFGTTEAPIVHLHPDQALLLREQGGLGYRNFIYLKGVPASLLKENGAYDDSVAGWTTNLAALITNIKANCNLVNKDRSVAGNTALVSTITDVTAEKIVRRKSGRPFGLVPRGRRR